ncbi:hypothetical protein HifGL_001218 [Haemophilus influenzae KR494]|nr:hypothetical protein HifGL_001218 [Haemophilus influenzae KR494]BBF05544.1 hypothetical protein CHBNIII6_12290 [Haemophilus influenzae]GBK73608.1 hypothetical protein NTHiID1_09990 [Haemophilus influenzae]
MILLLLVLSDVLISFIPKFSEKLVFEVAGGEVSAKAGLVNIPPIMERAVVIVQDGKKRLVLFVYRII